MVGAASGSPISPAKFTELLMYDLRDLEAYANVKALTAEREPNNSQLQLFMRRSLAVVKALLDMRFAPEVAWYWYRGFRMVEFGRKTPIMVLSEDRTEQVIEILKRVFELERPGIADLYEKSRQDTLALHERALQIIKMLSAEEAARVCGIAATGLTPLDLARTISSAKPAVYVMDGSSPVFPACQFNAEGPKLLMSRIMETLGPYRTNWDIVLWLCGPNGWLDGDTPCELMDSEPDLVLDAAFQDVVEDVEAKDSTT